MTDERPRPEYGEYATVEEQAAAIGTVPEALQDITPQAVPETTAPVVPVRRWDLVVTMALLIAGIWETISTFGGYADMPNSLQETYAVYGYTGAFPNASLASAIGIVLNVVQVVAILFAAFFASRRLRTGKVAFWIPLIGLVTVALVTVVLMGIIVATDPSFVEFFTKTMQK